MTERWVWLGIGDTNVTVFYPVGKEPGQRERPRIYLREALQALEQASEEWGVRREIGGRV